MIGNSSKTHCTDIRQIAAALVIIVSACGQYAFAQHGPEAKVSVRYPAGSIRSVEEADAALSAAAAERTAIEARYQAEEQACHPKFFTTSCIDQAKERRRVALSALRPVEIEANTFKRQARVIERDKDLAERLEKAERERKEREVRAAAAEPRESAAPDAAARKEDAPAGPDRSERHAAKLRQQQSDDAAMAKKRAANVAAYEQKKREALQRQEKVARRKAEKEEKRKTNKPGNEKSDLK